MIEILHFFINCFFHLSVACQILHSPVRSYLRVKIVNCISYYMVQVDRGVTLSEALLRHDKWLEKKGIKNSNFAVVTWSNWDCRVMLESECRFKKIRKPPYFNR